MTKKILITGASGFIGGYLVDKALEMGFDTYAGIRASSNKQYLRDARIKFCYLDYEDHQNLKEELSHHRFDYIIHNAGITKAKNEEDYYKVNEGYLINFVNSLIQHELIPSKFIFISSLAAYGPAEYTSEGIVTEDSTPHPVTSYGKSKLAGEKFLKTKIDFPYNIIRPTAVYGPREQDLLTVYELINRRLELFIGYNKQQLTFVYVQDLVDIIFQVLLKGKAGKNYFATDGNSYSSEELHNAIKENLKKPTIKIKLPIFAVETLARLTELYSKMSNRYPALNKEKVNELKCQSWVCDVAPLQEDFNFVPQFDLKRGMAKTISWNKEQGLL